MAIQLDTALDHSDIQGFRTTFNPPIETAVAEQRLREYADDLEYMEDVDLLDDLEIHIRDIHDDANRNMVYVRLLRAEILERMK